jgi:hypothetical protein
VARSKKQPLPEAGAAFAFRLDDGRYGVCRVLRQAHGNDIRELGGAAVLVATSAWIGGSMPDPADPALRPILQNTRIFPNGGQPVLEWQDVPPPRGFKLIGTIPPTAPERKMSCGSSGFWENSPIMLFGLWQWGHDREALLAEEAAECEQEKREIEVRNAAIEARQKEMSLEKLSKYRFFANWKESPSKEAVRASRAAMKTAVLALIALGPKATKAKMKQVLKACIEEFNELDRTLDHFIETTERQDICAEFDLLVHACGLGEHDSLADEWRDW